MYLNRLMMQAEAYYTLIDEQAFIDNIEERHRALEQAIWW